VDSRSGVLPIRLARVRDAGALLALRRAAEDWLAERGIQQWSCGEVRLADIVRQLERREWFVSTTPSGVVTAALRLLEEVEGVWPDGEPALARYVRGLMVNRAVAPVGAGAAILAWAEARAVGQGATVMRLDCVESNARLRRFYADLGYSEVGRRDFDGPWFSATLFEKNLETATRTRLRAR
jgi:hypothetical protein